MDTACREFVKILKEAEAWGSHPNVNKIAQKLTRLPANADGHTVYEERKKRGWVYGAPWGPWLTEEGKK